LDADYPLRGVNFPCRSTQLKIIEPLTNPTAHGGSASDAFHLVIPSLPGYGFSGKPTTTGWGPEQIARAWVPVAESNCATGFVSAAQHFSVDLGDSPGFTRC